MSNPNKPETSEAFSTIWINWWRTLSLEQRLAPALFLVIYWSLLRAMNGFRSEHVVIGFAFAAMHYTGPPAKRIREFLIPMFWIGVLYDSQRFYAPHFRSVIHVIEPYLWDLRHFGIRYGDSVLTPNEWWQLHTHPVLDVISGIFYVTLIAAFMSVAGYFAFILSRKGTAYRSPAQFSVVGTRMMWGLFVLNVVGYATYCIYAAAPPWYVSDHGLGPAILDTAASPAGGARFDHLLGLRVFAQIYSQSTNVFGAIPSLHIAYPTLALFYAVRMRALRVFCVFYLLGMSFSAIYLNHHYVLDVLIGALYGLSVGVGTEVVARVRAARRAALSEHVAPVQGKVESYPNDEAYDQPGCQILNPAPIRQQIDSESIE